MFSGLRLFPLDMLAAGRAVGISIVCMTLTIALIDGCLFRALPVDYIAFYTSPLAGRTLPVCILAGIEEIRFRLVFMSTLVALLTLWRGKLSAPGFVAVIVVTQFANVAHLLVHQPVYGTMRYLAVGCVWGLLYWKHGWLAAFAGHTLCHLMLDPVLMFVLLQT